jgi:hypothetical protein
LGLQATGTLPRATAITGGFVARYQRQTSAAGEDHVIQRMEQLSSGLKEVHAEVQDLRPMGHGSEAGSRAQAGSTEPHESVAARER